MKLVIVGAGELARLAHLAFAEESDYEVAACAVSREYAGEARLGDLPVAMLEELETSHPPEKHHVFVAIGYRGVNRPRRAVVEDLRARGYTLATFRSPHCHVARDVELRPNTFLFEGVIVQPFVTLGDDVIVWSGAVIAHDTDVGSHCFIGPNASISGNVTLGENCFVGINATIRDGVAVAPDCVIGAGAVIKSDTQPGEVYSAVATQASSKSSAEYDRL